MKALLVICLVLAALILILLFHARKNAIEFISRSDKLPMDEDTCSENGKGYTHQYHEAMKTVSRLVYEPLSILSQDGLKLSGKLYRMRLNNHRLVIGFHGYHSSDLFDMARFFSLYELLGYDIMVITERAHRDSEGSYITFGSLEQEDGLLWIRKAAELYHGNVQIVLHGVSMGAATVDLIAGREELPPQVRCAVSDCAYTSMADEANAKFRMPSWIMTVYLQMMNYWIEKLAHFGISDAAPIKAVAHARVPILFIHGEDDTLVPLSMMERLYENCSSEKDRLTVPQAGHAESYTVDSRSYGERFAAFVKKYIGDTK
ncbi:MAG: alpha/beta hydrolase [Erysipelotrichia bacterium]|nr:alpha/beta hydrolase [Erysipelotrichia bacterium]